MGYRRLVLFGAVVAVVAVASVPMAGQAPRVVASTAAPAKPWTSPRTAWGDPDLQGTWRQLVRVPLERAEGAAEFLTDAEVAEKLREAEELYARLAAGETELNAERGLPLRNGVWYVTGEKPRVSRRTSAIIDPPNGRVPPWTPQQIKRWEAREAAKRGRGHGDSWEDRSLVERCIGFMEEAALGYYGLIRPAREEVRVSADEFDRSKADRELIGFGDVPPGGVGSRILQAPGYVVMYTEGNNQGQYRVIPLDGRPALGPKIRQWTGVSRGHWEGNTLVIETTNINDQQDGGRFIPSQTTAHYPGSGETLRVTERYTRLDADTIEHRYTINDPETFVRPYTILREWTRDDKFAMAPGVCHENNDGLVGVFAAGRADEAWSLRYTEAEQRNRQRRLEEMKAEWAERNESR
jgi:hypothetical protein